jgi:hypothetical protein
MENHNYYVVIPAYILLDKNLSDKQKLLIGLISNMSNRKGYCFAGNKYLADCLCCSESTVRHLLQDLETKNFIGRVIKLNAKNEVEFRSLTVIISEDTPPSKNRHTPAEIQTEGYSEKRTHNNIPINNREDSIAFDVFWDLYNNKVGEKRGCERKWSKLSSADRKKIIEVLPSWKSKIRDLKFLPYPSTFLNQQRWNDITFAPSAPEMSHEEYEALMFPKKTEADA